jgi:hypothetical protein
MMIDYNILLHSILLLKHAHLLDWQGVFALHEQDKNPFPSEIYLIISRTENSTFL